MNVTPLPPPTLPPPLCNCTGLRLHFLLNHECNPPPPLRLRAMATMTAVHAIGTESARSKTPLMLVNEFASKRRLNVSEGTCVCVMCIEERTKERRKGWRRWDAWVGTGVEVVEGWRRSKTRLWYAGKAGARRETAVAKPFSI